MPFVKVAMMVFVIGIRELREMVKCGLRNYGLRRGF